jgi:hypothetical protein
MSLSRQQWILFLVSFITFAWFHQGGGWNQNARFAEVRALVEQGTFAVDDYMVYRPGEGRKLVREDLENAEFMRDGKVHRLCWGNDPWDINLTPVNGKPLTDGAEPVIIGWHTCTGDVGIAPDGHFHPNKPPGASLMAVPVYFVLWHAERLLGLNPDDWWILNANAWLCSALTIGLLSALGVVVIYRLAQDMSRSGANHSAALGVAIAFGFGTTFFPFATLMFDHNLTAVLLLCSFAGVRSERPFIAGLCAGFAAVTNYLAAIPGAMFGLWALLRGRLNPKAAMLFTLGVVPCFLGLLFYNQAAFGSYLALNTSFQNPVFKETAPAFLGMFTAPSWFAALTITISPWRGVFVLSPVLLLSLPVLWRWWKERRHRAEVRLILGISLFFFIVNICFNGFHGGFAAGPRYLIPVLPFLCLPLVDAFSMWRSAAWLVGLFSICQQSLLTFTDALNPLGVGAHAWRNHPLEWRDKIIGNSLVWRYAWPLFSADGAWPVIHAKFEEWMEGQERKLSKELPDATARAARLAEIRADTWSKVERGEQEPLWIAAMPGPVSVNPMGVWDGTYFQQYPARSEPARWGAFNIGEFIFPQSRWSVFPLLIIWSIGAYLLRSKRTS